MPAHSKQSISISLLLNCTEVMHITAHFRLMKFSRPMQLSSTVVMCNKAHSKQKDYILRYD